MEQNYNFKNARKNKVKFNQFFRNKSTSYYNNNDDDWLITFNDDDRWFLDTIVTFFNIEEMSKNQKQYFSMIFMKNFILFFIGKKRKTLTNECNI